MMLRPPPRKHLPALRWLMLSALAAAPALAGAQATVKPDGEFRYAFGAGASYSSGNTSASSLNLNGEAVRATSSNKLLFGGKALWARTDGNTTAQNAALNAAYNQDFTPLWFSFGTADFLRDEFANIKVRGSLRGGVGRHVIKRDDLTWDVSVGAGYSRDLYFDPVVIDDGLRTRYGRAEAVLAEESSHKFTETTTFRQKLSVFPSLRSGGGVRGTFDSGLSVAMTSRLSLTAGLNYRYDSDPGEGLKRADTLFVTGISVKLD